MTDRQPISTTFTLLRNAHACKEGYQKLAEALGGVSNYGENTLIPLARIVKTNNLGDALWCLRAALPEQKVAVKKLARLFACD